MAKANANVVSHIALWVGIIAGIPGCMWMVRPHLVLADDFAPMVENMAQMKTEQLELKYDLKRMRLDQLNAQIFQLQQTPNSARGEAYHVLINRLKNNLTLVESELEVLTNAK